MMGILGGTFDPVHYGHIELARLIQERFKLRELRLIPSLKPAHRSPPQASPSQRLAMLELAVEGYPFLKVDRCEMKRGGTSYTVDTLSGIRHQIGPEESLIFILGIDAFNQLTQWKNWRSLLDFCHLIVVNRPDNTLSENPQLKQFLKEHQTDNALQLSTRPAGYIYVFNIAPLDFSATAIRTQASSTGIAAVDQFIKQHQLYRSPMDLIKLNQLIKNTLEEAKALEITEIDVRNMTDVCDTLFICTATSGRHARSIEIKLRETTKLHFIPSLGRKEDADDSWILVDLNRTVIHIMLEEARRFYNLEQLWDLTANSREKHAD